MTKKETNKELEKKTILEDYYKLSIQVSLNGLSFCILDTIGNRIIKAGKKAFDTTLNPVQVLQELERFLKEQQVQNYSFSEVVAVHRNDLFNLVPKVLFDPDELPNYLKFNAKMLDNDLLEYDELSSFEMMNVYVPFVNINNHLYELFGEFEFNHHATVLINSLLGTSTSGTEPVCYLYATDHDMDLIIVQNKKLLFFNHFAYSTKEDLLYYLLFSLEQLKLDPHKVKLRLFGEIREGDAIYKACEEYIQHTALYIPAIPESILEDQLSASAGYLELNTL
jgi:hypothetical protein